MSLDYSLTKLSILEIVPTTSQISKINHRIASLVPSQLEEDSHETIANYFSSMSCNTIRGQLFSMVQQYDRLEIAYSLDKMWTSCRYWAFSTSCLKIGTRAERSRKIS